MTPRGLLSLALAFALGALAVHLGAPPAPAPAPVPVAPTAPAPAPAKPEQAPHPGQGWRWGTDAPDCPPEDVVLQLSAADVDERGGLTPRAADKAADVFRRCGLVAIPGAVSAEAVSALNAEIDATMEPYLASRARLRAALERAMLERLNLREMWDSGEFDDELLLSGGLEYRERTDGRIDLTHAPEPGSALMRDDFVANPLLLPVLRRLLGADVQVKSLHSMVALPASEGNNDQLWHRDTDLLFADGPPADAHAHRGGLHLPPYAVNLFVPLVDFERANGPTEFVLTSHQWGPGGDEPAAADFLAELPAGTAVLADYRTIHRGTINRSDRTRPMAMVIHGREWWDDTINYGVRNYGGFDAALQDMDNGHLAYLTASTTVTPQMRRRLFFGLINKWEQGIMEGLTRRYGSG